MGKHAELFFGWLSSLAIHVSSVKQDMHFEIWHLTASITSSTKQSVLTTAKATLMTRDVLSTVSPCGQNCTFMMTFYGPTVKCNTTTLNEIGLIPESASDTYRAPIYSGGWSTVNDRGLSQSASLVPGWVLPDGASETSRKDRPDTFFVARHELATQHPVSAITNTSSYPRTTYLTSCKLHRGIYSLNTVYSKGQRNLRLTTDARESLDSLWHMTEENIESLRLPDPPINVEVTNLFALADSLVQALTGEYYNHSVIRRQDLLKPKPWRPDPRLGYLRKPVPLTIAPSLASLNLLLSLCECRTDLYRRESNHHCGHRFQQTEL
jgi:hypothetical protein